MSKVRYGVCMVPFGNPAFDHAWLQPKPVVKSWQVLRSIGFTDVRLQFQIGGDKTVYEAPVSTEPGMWDTSLFRAFIVPAYQAGMKIEANYCVEAPIPAHQDAAFHEASAYRFVKEFGSMIDSYSYFNEPGDAAKKYEGEGGPTAERDYMRDVYFPKFCLPFVLGIRRAKPDAWIIGCDADSEDIQRRYIEVADGLLRPQLTSPINICDEEAIHPYYHVNPVLDYASLNGANGKPGFLTDRPLSRPWGITEIDDSDPDKPFAFVESIARGEYGPCTRYYELFQGPEHRWFEVGKNAHGLPCSSFYTDPIVNDSGRRYAKIFEISNGPVDPPKRTMPIRHRAAGK